MRKALSVVVGLLLAATLAAQPREVRVSAVLDAVDECAILNVSGMGTATIQVQGSFVGIVTWSSGSAGVPVTLMASAVNSPALPVSTTRVEGRWIAAIPGAESVQACLTSYTSGVVTVTMTAIPFVVDSRPPCNPVTKLSGLCRP